jgi:hypothetical protein
MEVCRIFTPLESRRLSNGVYENAAECPALCLPAGRQGRG